MSAVAEEVDTDAVLRECRRLRMEMFRADRDFAIASLSRGNELDNRILLMLPEKFHAPFVARMCIAQDAIRRLRADTKPPDYWIGDAADFIEIANSETA